MRPRHTTTYCSYCGRGIHGLHVVKDNGLRQHPACAELEPVPQEQEPEAEQPELPFDPLPDPGPAPQASSKNEKSHTRTYADLQRLLRGRYGDT